MPSCDARKIFAHKSAKITEIWHPENRSFNLSRCFDACSIAPPGAEAPDARQVQIWIKASIVVPDLQGWRSLAAARFRRSHTGVTATAERAPSRESAANGPVRLVAMTTWRPAIPAAVEW